MSVWRCSECRHGRRLTACARAVASGPLGADGELSHHDDVTECFVFADSIQCDVHPSAVIEKKVDGRFCRWQPCECCDGRGTRRRYEGERRCDDCGGTGGEWVAPTAASSVPVSAQPKGEQT